MTLPDDAATLLAEPYPIGEADVRAYEEQGWLRIPALVPRAVVEALAARFDNVSRALRKTVDDADPYFTDSRYHRQHRIYNDPANVDDLFRVVAHSKRLVGVASALMRAEHVVYLRTTVFEKPSARTRVSTEMAVHTLGGHAVALRGEEVGIGTRESAADVARTLAGYCAVIAARVFDHRPMRHDATA